MNKNYLSIAVGLILAFVALVLLLVFQVRQTEVVMVTTFGKPTRTIAEPGGPHLKWPWPIQKVYRFDKRVHSLEDQYEEMLTRDQRNVNVTVYAGWTIDDPALFLPTFGDASITEAEKNLRSLLSTHKSAVIGRHDLSELINSDTNALKFQAIEREILDAVRPKAKSSYGIDIKFVGLKRLEFPEAVTAKVLDRMRSERQLQVSKIQSEGEEQALTIRGQADRDRDRLLASAESEATRIVSEADAKAYEYFAVFKEHPQLANFNLKLKALETVTTNRTTLLLDPRTPPFDLLLQVTNQLPEPGSNH